MCTGALPFCSLSLCRRGGARYLSTAFKQAFERFPAEMFHDCPQAVPRPSHEVFSPPSFPPTPVSGPPYNYFSSLPWPSELSFRNIFPNVSFYPLTFIFSQNNRRTFHLKHVNKICSWMMSLSAAAPFLSQLSSQKLYIFECLNFSLFWV